MDVLEQFPVRKTKKQKLAFRTAVQSYAESLGYPVSVETGTFGACNLLLGDPEQAKFLVTAHYDTCAGMPIPNFITPCNLPLFLLHQLALTGLFAAVYLCAVNGFILLFEDHRFSSLLALICVAFLVLWMLIGPANKCNANDNTSGVVTVLETARTMPENLRSRVCFVLFDLEEAGLVGSATYRKTHKAETEGQIILNLDCVGDGDEIVFFPTKKMRKDGKKLAWLYKAIGRYGDKTIDVREKGFAVYPSDQKHFPYGVGIASLHRKKWIGLYMNRIHTKRDTILEETNVNILRACLTTLIASDAAE